MKDQKEIEQLFNQYRAEICARSPKSLAIWQENRNVMPAGVGSLFRLADPFPMVVKRAKGARLWDADGNEYLDFMLGFSTMILGNAPEEVEAALREALPRGTSYGQCHEGEYAFARLFRDMIPGVEKVAFCNSGTEATMYALRLARATVGRPLLQNSRAATTGLTTCWRSATAGPARGATGGGRSKTRPRFPKAPDWRRAPGKIRSFCRSITRQPSTRSAVMPASWRR
jgi:glutamate-1-semialdehyde 2,1-aminomutase